MEPEVIIYYQECKKATEPGYAYFYIQGRDLVGLNGGEIAHSRKDLEKRICKLARRNHGLIVRNQIPFADYHETTFLETLTMGFTNKYRPLTPQEIPKAVRPLIKKGLQRRYRQNL